MLSWLWDLLVSFFTFIAGLLGLKKKSVTFADEATVGESVGDEKKEEVAPVESVKE